MGYLSSIMMTDNYPEWIDDLVEDYDILITNDEVMAKMEEGGNISNTFIEIVFEEVKSHYDYTHLEKWNVEVNNMASHLYFDGDRAENKCYLDDIIKEVDNNDDK